GSTSTKKREVRYVRRDADPAGADPMQRWRPRGSRRMSSRRSSDGRRRGEEGRRGYPLPPALAKLPSAPRRPAREFADQNQRNLILRGALTVFGTKGIAEATVQDLIDAASVSRATFYKHFDDKSACFAALHDELLDWLGEEAREEVEGVAGWSARVAAACHRLVHLMVTDPRIARLCTVEPLLAGAPVRARQDAAIAELAEVLRGGRAERSWGPGLPGSLEPLLIGGATFLVAKMATG